MLTQNCIRTWCIKCMLSIRNVQVPLAIPRGGSYANRTGCFNMWNHFAECFYHTAGELFWATYLTYMHFECGTLVHFQIPWPDMYVSCNAVPQLGVPLRVVWRMPCSYWDSSHRTLDLDPMWMGDLDPKTTLPPHSLDADPSWVTVRSSPAVQCT